MGVSSKAVTRARPGRIRALLLTTLLSSVLMSSCGIHLRNTTLPENLRVMALDCPTELSWLLCQTLATQLKDSGVSLDPEAQLKLEIEHLPERRRAVSLQPDGSAAEYDLIQSVRYRLIMTTGNTVIAEELVTRSQSYQQDDTRLIAKERERDEIDLQLFRRLSSAIMRKVSSYDTERINEILAQQT